MSTRLDLAVTLSHEEAKTALSIISDYARERYEHARKTRSEAVRSICISTAQKADKLAERLASSMYQWVD